MLPQMKICGGVHKRNLWQTKSNCKKWKWIGNKLRKNSSAIEKLVLSWTSLLCMDYWLELFIN